MRTTRNLDKMHSPNAVPFIEGSSRLASATLPLRAKVTETRGELVQRRGQRRASRAPPLARVFAGDWSCRADRVAMRRSWRACLVLRPGLPSEPVAARAEETGEDRRADRSSRSPGAFRGDEHRS